MYLVNYLYLKRSNEVENYEKRKNFNYSSLL